jgi:hypothetical protein
MKTIALQIVACLLAALALTGCTTTVETSAAPSVQGVGGFGADDDVVAAAPPTCDLLRCNDALAHAAHGDFCPEADQLITDLDVCNDKHCLAACDDDAFRGLATPNREAGCLACLEKHCTAEVSACAADRSAQ